MKCVSKIKTISKIISMREGVMSSTFIEKKEYNNEYKP